MLQRITVFKSSRTITTVLIPLVAIGLFVAGFTTGCGDDEPEMIQTTPEQKSDRGENCTARNDCVEGLACVNNTCVQHEYNISPEASHCELIQCESDDECCTIDLSDDECDDLEDDCNAGNFGACNQYEDECVCDLECQDSQCIQLDETEDCVDDFDCAFGETCANGECVQCESDGDCDGDDQCVSGVCEPTCKVDSNCPLFHECNSGECVETGCTTDRECIHYTDNHRAECHDETGSCSLPCDTDSDCNQGSFGQFEVCDNGICVFIGCESDQECRTALQLEGTDNYERAECVDN